MGTWTQVAENAETMGLEIAAYWEGNPEMITRISVRGAGEDCGLANRAAARVLRAYGSDADVDPDRWEAGEGDDEYVLFVSEAQS